MIDPVRFNVIVGWMVKVAGATSGAAIGLFFHDEEWMGYGSFRRRLMRLGHISFFGLGIINVLFALSIHAIAVPPSYGRFASGGFAVAALTTTRVQ